MKTTIKATKQQLCNALRAFINQRSGIEWANYAGSDHKSSRAAFMGDYRPILKHGKEARQMLAVVENIESITAENLIEATRAFSGRLQFAERNGKIGAEYCTGQYFPNEYRKAACAVLALCLHDYYAATMPKPDGKETRTIGHGAFKQECEFSTIGGLTAGEYIRKQATQIFGRSIVKTWFN